MIKRILIVGNESALTNAIESEAARRVETYTVALLSNRLSGDGAKIVQTRQEKLSVESSANQEQEEKGRIPLEWNPGSPISARTLIIAAENRLEYINEAILVCDPPSIRCAASDLSMANVEVLVNDHIKSWFFLVKELAMHFRARGEGFLALVYPEATSSRDDTADLLGPAALAAFRSFTRGLLSAALNEPYFTLGFSGAETGDEAGFAAFVFKQLDEENRRSNGKLYKYGKLGFFR
ncbi:MAG: hypothetical protein LBI06_05440 [Treponema sp.]|jgi:hypothetical protein|nr:hypothetical protein [Treponema sp.]